MGGAAAKRSAAATTATTAATAEATAAVCYTFLDALTNLRAFQNPGAEIHAFSALNSSQQGGIQLAQHKG
jgi:hypothetical protein